eukprot:760109_1
MSSLRYCQYIVIITSLVICVFIFQYSIVVDIYGKNHRQKSRHTFPELQCYHNISGYAYMSKILQQINSNPSLLPRKYTSEFIDSHLRDRYLVNINFMRIKYYNGSLYEDTYGQPGGYKPLYRKYFAQLFQNALLKMNTSMPNFDVIIWIADYNFNTMWGPGVEKKASKSHVIFQNYHNMKWNRNSFPLLTVPRSILKLHYDWKERHYFDEYLEHSSFPNYTKQNQINKFFMRCTPRHWMRTAVTWNSSHPSLPYKKYKKYFNIKMTIPPVNRPNNTTDFKECLHWIYNNKTNCWDHNFTAIKQEMKYKYIVSIDGIGTRDALARTIHYEHSVNIMYNSSKVEFWYLDLKNNEHVIQFNDVDEYLEKASKIIEGKYPYSIDEIADKARAFCATYLDLNNVNCFAFNMFRVYTTYFFDSSSVSINQTNDILLVDTNTKH